MDSSDSLVLRSLVAFRELGVNENSRLLLGISGGVDSVSLAHVLVKLFHEQAFADLALIHINHQLRNKESHRDEEFVRTLAAEWNLALEVVRSETYARHEAKKESIELAARNERYSAFNEFASRNSYTHVLTAHNADDQVETVLMNIFRGTGLRGLGGIPRKRSLADGVDLIRPWLGVLRAEIEAFARAEQLSFCQDSSNDSRAYFRNRIRHDVLPYLETQFPERDLRATIHRMSEVLRSDWQVLQVATQGAFHRIERVAPPSLLRRRTIALDLPALLAIEQSLWYGIFESAFEALLRKRVRLSSKSSHRISQFLPSQALSLQLGARVIIRKTDNLLLMTEDLKQSPKETVPIEIRHGFTLETAVGMIEVELLGVPKIVSDPNKAYFDRDRVMERGLVLRPWTAGERIHPFGMEGSKLVSNLLNEHGIKGAADKNHVPVIADATSGEILWIPGVRSSEHYKVTNATQHTLLLIRIPHKE
jgi:tRNA(Ile)-lysidine synthase